MLARIQAAGHRGIVQTDHGGAGDAEHQHAIIASEFAGRGRRPAPKAARADRAPGLRRTPGLMPGDAARLREGLRPASTAHPRARGPRQLAGYACAGIRHALPSHQEQAEQAFDERGRRGPTACAAAGCDPRIIDRLRWCCCPTPCVPMAWTIRRREASRWRAHAA